MKTCPVCKAQCFDDMEVCYGCLHRFADDGRNGAQLLGHNDQTSSTQAQAAKDEAKRQGPPDPLPPAAVRGDVGNPAKVPPNDGCQKPFQPGARQTLPPVIIDVVGRTTGEAEAFEPPLSSSDQAATPPAAFAQMGTGIQLVINLRPVYRENAGEAAVPIG